ncbi:Signal transduction response regulator [Variovorax sp. WDL1]|nr:Signal transduction response regulator [Variovorax sp. WDL1]
MAMPPVEDMLSFGPFRLLPAQKLLLEGERQLRLGSRAFDILGALACRAGEVLSKEELIAHAWPDTVVEESSLRVGIAALRRALGDGREGVRYIANIPGRGYCFVAPVVRSRPGAQRPARIAAGQAHNLPLRLTRMIGRAGTVESLALELPRHRFLSVVGPGGIGKTTVALALAEQRLASYPDGVRFVDLAMVSEPGRVPGALAAVLDVARAAADPMPGLLSHLRERRLLIVLDNCEHVVEAAATLAVRVLKAAAGVHVLATSREPLCAEGERVHRLASLPAPPESAGLTAAAAMGFPAVQLFVERAVASLDSFELRDGDACLAAELCRRLDGLPLAIELAAARVGFFGIRELVARLDDRFRLLSSGRRTVLPRHQTLRALLDWSYELLSDGERVTLRRLSAFRGSFTLESAGAVAGDEQFGAPEIFDALEALVAKSLVVVDARERGTRYRLLDTTRGYAIEKLLQTRESATVFARHARHLCDLLEAAELEAPTWVFSRADSSYGRLVDEVRAALDWAFSPGGDPALGVTLTTASVTLAHRLSLFDEFRVRAGRALAHLATLQQPPALAEIRLNVVLGAFVGQSVGAVEMSDGAFRRARELAQHSGEARHRIEALYGDWVCAFGHADYPRALRLGGEFGEAARAVGDELGMEVADRMLAQSHHYLGDHARARALAESVLRHPAGRLRSGGNRLPSLDCRVSMRIVLARILWLEGRPEQAMRLACEALDHALADVAFGVCQAIALAAFPIAMWTGDEVQARSLLRILGEYARSNALDYWGCWARHFEGLFPGAEPDAAPADDKQSDLMATLGSARAGPRQLARVAQAQVGWCAPEILRVHGENLLAGGAPDREAEEFFQRSLQCAREQGALSWELRSATSLARLWQRQGREAQARDLLAAVRGRFSEGFATADLRMADRLLAANQGAEGRSAIGAHPVRRVG